MARNLKYITILIVVIGVVGTINLSSRPGGGQSFSDNSSTDNTSSNNTSSDNSNNKTDNSNSNSYDYSNSSSSDNTSHTVSSDSGGNLDGHSVMMLFLSFCLLGMGLMALMDLRWDSSDKSLLFKAMPYISFLSVGFGITTTVLHNIGVAHNSELKLIFYIWGGIFLLIEIKSVFRPSKSQTISSQSTYVAKPTAPSENRLDLEKQTIALQTADPEFSLILFKEFANLLYSEFYNNLGKPSIVKLKPYLQIYQPEMAQGNTYTEIVVGASVIKEIEEMKRNRIIVDFIANFTELKKDTGLSMRYEVDERWVFSREKGVLTPGIEKMQAITCPSCGASADFGDAGICNHCNNTIVAGQMQWTIADRLIYKQYEFQVKGLGYYAEEQGTDLETNISGSLEKQAYKLAEINNQPQENRETWWRNFSNSFSKDIATKYFDQIYQAWSNNNLGPVRHLLTDRIFMSFMFWIDNYKQAHLQNKLEQIHVNKVEICKLQLDKNFVSITTRIHASCLDYTVDDKGEIYGGSNTVPRKFSEYWIFIRSQNNFNQSVEIQKCPSCGAEIDKMGQGAVCGYCNSKISTGNFSWVLSTIIQDEVYKPNM